MLENSEKTLNKSQYLAYRLLIKLLFSGKQMLILSLVFLLVVYSKNFAVPPAVGEKITKDWGNTVEATDDSYTIKHIKKRLDEHWKEQKKDITKL